MNPYTTTDTEQALIKQIIFETSWLQGVAYDEYGNQAECCIFDY
jgi:hypothetical protein